MDECLCQALSAGVVADVAIRMLLNTGAGWHGGADIGDDW